MIDFLVMLAILLGLAALGAGSLRRCTWIVAGQGIVLGLMLLASNVDELHARLVATALASIALKGLVFPWLIFRSMREAGAIEESEPYIGFTMSLILGATALGVAFALSSLLPLPASLESNLIVPASLAYVFFGLIMLVGRKTAVAQVLGYLVMENGIFIFSLALVAELPTLVELGVLLDLFVAIFVMGITIFQINRQFDHIDTSQLHELEEAHTGRRHMPGRQHHAAGAGSQQPETPFSYSSPEGGKESKGAEQ